jgi:isopenicillin N synthase-like dioxygenase
VRVTPFRDKPRLPIIDLSLFELGDPWRDHLAAQLDWAASEFGCFYVVGHGVDQELVDSALAVSRRFFAQQPVGEQHPLPRGRAWQGRFPFQFLQEEHASNPGAHGERHALPELPGFEEVALEYMTALSGLGHRLMAGLGRGLRLGEAYFVEKYTSNAVSRLHVLDTPPGSLAAGDSSDLAGEHTDEGLITILSQDAPGALEFRYDDHLIEIPHLPGSLVCSVGDALEWLTRGRYRSAVHREVNVSTEHRVSLSFFFASRPGVRLRTERERPAGTRILAAESGHASL